MINVSFLGNNLLINQLKDKLKHHVNPTVTSDSDIIIVVINDINDFNHLPKHFEKPALLCLNNNDPRLIQFIKNFNFSGVIPFGVPVAQLLSKINTIATLEQSKTVNENEILKAKILAKADNIPPLPIVAQELLKLTRSDEGSLKKIIDKIKTDQGISSKVLKLINSPFYALRKEITSIDQASMLLGTATIKNIVLSVSIEDFYKKNFSIYGTTGNKLWEHSHNTATIAEIIGKKLKLDSDACYLAGLMHDIGKVVLVDFLVKETKNFEDEKSQTGMTHQEVAGIVLGKWGLGKQIINSVVNHHTVDNDIFNKIIYFANQIENEKECTIDLIKHVQFDLKVDLSELIHIFEQAKVENSDAAE